MVLATGHKNIFSRIWQGIKDFFDSVFNAIGKFHFQSGEAQLLDKLDKRYKKLEKTFIDILRSLGTETSSAEENLSENKKEAESAKAEKSSKKSLKDDAYKDYDKPITVEDVEILRSIGRKSINEFTAEDIIKAQKWAHKFYDELRTKSPFFRAWFGDWRSEEKDTKLDSITIKPLEISSKNDAVSYLKSGLRDHSLFRGDVKNADTEFDINIGNQVYNDTLTYANRELSRKNDFGKYKAEISILTKIKEIAESGVLLDTATINDSENIDRTFMHYFYSVCTLENQPYLVKLSVDEINANYGTIRRAYNVNNIKISPIAVTQVYKPAVTIGDGGEVLSTYSISDLFSIVKQYDKEFSPKPVNSLLLNDDGTPKVFYHGTRSNFDEFVLQDRATFGRALGDGFYFTPDYQKAHKFANGLFSKGEDRGGIVMPVYLQMKNPYVIELDADRTQWSKEYNKGDYDGIIDLKNNTWYVEDSTQIKSATEKGNIGTFDKTDPNIKHSIKDTSYVETRESIAEAFKSLAATDGEKKIVKDYTKSIEKIDKSFEKKKDLFLKLQELKGKTDSESKSQREKYAAEIQKINDDIVKADESLLKIAAAEPFRSVVRKYQTDAYNKGYGKGFIKKSRKQFTFRALCGIMEKKGKGE